MIMDKKNEKDKKNDEKKSIERLASISRLLEVMDTMRNSEKACHWTKAQSLDSLVRHTIEEAYEVADAVERGDAKELKTELADLLNQIIFYAQIAKEAGDFDFYDVVEYLTEKLIIRHPNVFSDEVETDILTLEKNWEEMKKNERKNKNKGIQLSILDDIVQTLPALSVSHKLQLRAAQTGFDWSDKKDVFEKLSSEVRELESALAKDNEQEVLEEIGDLMFSCVNLIRHFRADPEQVLRKANHKFERRFRSVEASLKTQGKALDDASIEEMELLWQKAKLGE